MTDEAIPAATLVVWRDPYRSIGIGGDIGGRTVRRHGLRGRRDRFSRGRVDPADRALAAALGHPGEAAKITAIRETIEETAVVAALDGDIVPDLGRELQRALLGGADFAALLALHDLRPIWKR